MAPASQSNRSRKVSKRLNVISRYEVPFIQSLLQVYAHVANSLKKTIIASLIGSYRLTVQEERKNIIAKNKLFWPRSRFVYFM